MRVYGGSTFKATGGAGDGESFDATGDGTRGTKGSISSSACAKVPWTDGLLFSSDEDDERGLGKEKPEKGEELTPGLHVGLNTGKCLCSSLQSISLN